MCVCVLRKAMQEERERRRVESAQAVDGEREGRG